MAPVTIVGGYSPIDVNNMSNEQRAIDSFIRGSEEKYLDADLVKGEQQVVAGMNYKYTYNVNEIDQKGEVEVTVNKNLQGKKAIISEVPIGNAINSKNNVKVGTSTNPVITPIISNNPTPMSIEPIPSNTPSKIA